MIDDWKACHEQAVRTRTGALKSLSTQAPSLNVLKCPKMSAFLKFPSSFSALA